MDSNPLLALPPSAGVQFTPTLHDDTYAAIDPAKANLSGKNVLITGASKGLGRAMAISYAKAGASSIAILARSEQLLHQVAVDMLAAARSANRPPPKIMACTVDVTSQQTVEQTATDIGKAFGHLDILINNAGYMENYVPIGDSDPEEWWKVFEVNVKGVYLITRAFLPLLLKGPEKTIVEISSIGAHVALPGGSAYQLTKSLLLRWDEFLNLEYADQGILAYSIHPGGVVTELSSRLPLQSVLTDQPALGGDTVVWLTKERKEWLRSRYISCNWDMDELEAKKEEIVTKDLLKVRMAV